MEIRYSELKHYAFHATDGDIGGCQDVLIDDDQWIVRYLVADTNTWLPLSRKVVISPVSINNADPASSKLSVEMSKEALRNSPALEAHQPVSREYESLLFKYFGYGYYWTGPGAWGEYAHPLELVNNVREIAEPAGEDNSHLRSCDELTGYAIALSDGEAGHLEDLVFQLPQWSAADLIINLNDWLPGGKRVRVDCRHVVSIDWATHTIKLEISKQELEQSAAAD
ncbi:hypothetical protein [Alteromonas lipolytica]|uniref:PRC-barrel domain-containing protein n=1 Tax=Alteromonas lipolytica TaxID=1856405 RepID=A0A1E8FG17_9ALTE|nr:hypothetical protein [Alteromonas lipolytica]OFI34870.1 hypothetical protein BFC17_14965 [Alteromonas lipolytica]GGF54702.1 hypothetical protein GCM10011338_03610 [Alteromonas lipolytica]